MIKPKSHQRISLSQLLETCDYLNHDYWSEVIFNDFTKNKSLYNGGELSKSYLNVKDLGDIEEEIETLLENDSQAALTAYKRAKNEFQTFKRKFKNKPRAKEDSVLIPSVKRKSPAITKTSPNDKNLSDR